MIETIDNYSYCSSFLFFIFSILGIITAKLFQSGIYMMYARSLICSSFITISINHFLYNVQLSLKDDIKTYRYIIVITVFCLLSIIEIFIPKQNNINENSLMNRLKPLSIEHINVLFTVFLFLHSMLIGIFISFSFFYEDKLLKLLPIIIRALFEKYIESFAINLFFGKEMLNKILYYLLLILYSLIVPLTIVLVRILCSNFFISKNIIGILFSISSGIFLYTGILLWRRIFLIPYEWKKNELVIVSLFFVIGFIVQIITGIEKS